QKAKGRHFTFSDKGSLPHPTFAFLLLVSGVAGGSGAAGCCRGGGPRRRGTVPRPTLRVRASLGISDDRAGGFSRTLRRQSGSWPGKGSARRARRGSGLKLRRDESGLSIPGGRWPA